MLTSTTNIKSLFSGELNQYQNIAATYKPSKTVLLNMLTGLPVVVSRWIHRLPPLPLYVGITQLAAIDIYCSPNNQNCNVFTVHLFVFEYVVNETFTV